MICVCVSAVTSRLKLEFNRRTRLMRLVRTSLILCLGILRPLGMLTPGQTRTQSSALRGGECYLACKVNFSSTIRGKIFSHPPKILLSCTCVSQARSGQRPLSLFLSVSLPFPFFFSGHGRQYRPGLHSRSLRS